MKTMRSALAACLVLSGVAAFGSPALQIEFDKLAKPPKGSALAKAACAACHVAGKATLNSYGKDMAAALKAAKTKKLTAPVMRKLAKLDSDKDKATNGAELKAGTLPGDPKSKPAK
ncbi:MAG: hypothetical protein FJX72_10135 [Armatimonadetes bacterium]|nr:hypothetical protein [Armatimonadota bacterium]